MTIPHELSSPSPAPARGNKARNNPGRLARQINNILYWLGVVTILLVFLGPIIWMIVLAFHPQAGIFTQFALFKPTLQNFTSLVHKSNFLKSFINSALIGAITSLLAVTLSFPVSYVLVRYSFKQRADLGFWFLSGRMIPPIAIIIPFMIIYQRLNLLDKQVGLILVYLIPTMAFSVLILMPFIRSVPEELEQAALVDGCSRLGVLFKIVLPLSRHGLIVAMVFSLITSWNEFFFAFVLTRHNVRTLPVLIQSFLTFSNVRWGEMMATSTIVVLPLLLFVFLVQDYLITGLTLGAIEK